MARERTIRNFKLADINPASGRLRRKSGSRSQPFQGSGEDHLKGLSVLIVADDWPSIELLTGIMGNEGCTTQTAYAAEAALAILQHHTPDVIVLDLVLPLMIGLLLAHTLKSETATEQVLIIAVTALEGPDTHRVALEAGCAACVRKPIDPSAFAQLMKSLLRARPTASQPFPR